jgi:dynein heavy chain
MEESKGKVTSTNEIYTLKLAPKNYQWIKNTSTGDIPLPRCHHSACEIQKGQMLIFGGLYESNKRFNDTYILKVGQNMVWSQPPNQKSGQIPKNTESKIGAPEPRANHTSVFIKTQNKVLIFGGHGGLGYSRRSFNDLYELDCESFEWRKIEPKGSSPEPRGGHIAGLLPDGETMFI